MVAVVHLINPELGMLRRALVWAELPGAEGGRVAGAFASVLADGVALAVLVVGWLAGLAAMARSVSAVPTGAGLAAVATGAVVVAARRRHRRVLTAPDLDGCWAALLKRFGDCGRTDELGPCFSEVVGALTAAAGPGTAARDAERAAWAAAQFLLPHVELHERYWRAVLDRDAAAAARIGAELSAVFAAADGACGHLVRFARSFDRTSDRR